MDHATLNRWFIRYSSSLTLAAKKYKRTVATSWRMDETYIKIKEKWVYLYRAVDKFGDTIDFMLFEHRDEAAAIVLWNTVYLERSTQKLRESGKTFDNTLLQYSSPLGWEFTNLTRDYVWRQNRMIGDGQFRPLRTNEKS